jgi:hypothetical protein
MYEGEGDEDGPKKRGTANERYAADLDGFSSASFARERSCTDCLCLVIFILFVASMLGLTGYGF